MTPEEQHAVGVVTLSRLKQCLSEGYPVVFGFDLYWTDDESDNIPWQEDKEDYLTLQLPPKSERKRKDGHTVLAIGYEKNRKLNPNGAASGMVLCQNSWGTPASKNGWKSRGGLFWLPFSWILDWDATDDFWMLREFEHPRPEEPKFPTAVYPQYHQQRKGWDGKLTLFGPRFGENLDYLSTHVREHTSGIGVSCVFSNHSRYLLINDVPKEDGYVDSRGDNDHRSVARVIRPFSEQVNFGMRVDGVWSSAVFRLAVWDIPTTADLFMGKGDKSHDWSMEERASLPLSDLNVQKAKDWLEKYVTPNADNGGKLECIFPGSRPITYLFVVFKHACVELLDVGLEKGGIDFIENNRDEIGRLVGFWDRAFERDQYSAWQYMKDPTFIGGAFRSSPNPGQTKGEGLEPNTIAAIWGV